MLYYITRGSQHQAKTITSTVGPTRNCQVFQKSTMWVSLIWIYIYKCFFDDSHRASSIEDFKLLCWTISVWKYYDSFSIMIIIWMETGWLWSSNNLREIEIVFIGTIRKYSVRKYISYIFFFLGFRSLV